MFKDILSDIKKQVQKDKKEITTRVNAELKLSREHMNVTKKVLDTLNKAKKKTKQTRKRNARKEKA